MTLTSIGQPSEVKGVVTMGTLITRIEQAGAAIAGLCMVVIMLVLSVDALGRYAFRAPLPWAVDVVSQYLLVVTVYFAVSETFRYGDHINIGLIQSRMSKRVKAFTGVLYSLLAAAVFAIVAYGSAEHAIDAYQAGEFLPGYRPWPIWLSYLPIAMGSTVLTIRLLHHAAMLAMHGEDPSVILEGEEVE